MASVDERLKTLEAASKEVDPFAGILVEYNAEVLVRLLDLKGKMIAQGAGGGPGDAALREENRALRTENEKLKKGAAKDAYRIAHILKMLKAAESGKQV